MEVTLFENPHKHTCKGLVFKSTINNYVTDSKIVSSITLRLAKRKSCQCCRKCGWIIEEYSESLANTDNNPIINMEIAQHGKFYRLQTCNEETDWETGYIEAYDFMLVVHPDSI